MSIALFFAELLLGWLLADFLTGLLHWMEDRLGPGREHWPLLGRYIFAPNIEHHAKPLAFLDSGFIERNWTTWAATLLVAIPLVLSFGFQPWIVSAAIGGAMANEIHAWAHRKSMAPRWALPLQRIGFLQSPKQHALHHVPDHTRNYCAVTDWLNPVLERVAFWSTLERFLPRGAIQ